MASVLDKADLFHDLSGLNTLRAHRDAPEALKSACQQFEAFFTRQLLKTMREANEALDDDSLLDSQGSDFFRDMHDDQLSVHLSKSGGLGLADLMFRQISGMHGQVQAPGIPEALRRTDGVSALPASQGEASAPIGSRSAPKPPGAYPMLGSLSAEPAVTEQKPSQGTEEAGEGGWLDAAEEAFKKFASAPSPMAFVHAVWPFAKKAAEELGVSARVLIAQAALETGWGRSLISGSRESSKNLFNIKAGAGWEGPRQSATTLEYDGGVAVRRRESFRAYESFADSFSDYVDLIRNSPRYREAAEAVNDVASYARELQKAGYATDPAYADKMCRVYHSETLVNALRSLSF